MDNRIFCLMGPSASGKTALACELVQRFPFEIISVDSAMIYRGMDIGTAKPDKKTLAAAPHHLIDIVDPQDTYSVARFCDEVAELCSTIRLRQRIPLLVGGTMMYFHALTEGLSVLPSADASLRRELLQTADTRGWDYMHRLLNEVDKESAERIHRNDTQRILRALEVHRISGQPLSQSFGRRQVFHSDFVNFVLMPKDRAWLHERIAQRFDEMLHNGLIDEVQSLCKTWQLTSAHPSMRCVGYRQVIDYLQGIVDEKTLREKGIIATRQLVKRQMTWLRGRKETHMFAPEDRETWERIIVLTKQILDNTSS